ncbi:MAG: hypothetical protein Q9202_004972 [Teloschistes flavicans]
MSSYIPSLTNLVSNTTSRYTSALRQRITTTSTESDDLYIDDPDASHVSRVLRAYHKEQGKPLPAWLGVDPRDREKAQSQEKGGAGGYLGSLRRSAAGSGSTTPTGTGVGKGGGLGEIWGDGGATTGEGSLRRTGAGAATGLGAGRAPVRRPVAGGVESGGVADRLGGARPLPSQRAGSYQNVGAVSGGAGGGGSAQDRLRARLAGRMGSSGSTGSGSYGSGDEGGGRKY